MSQDTAEVNSGPFPVTDRFAFIYVQVYSVPMLVNNLLRPPRTSNLHIHTGLSLLNTIQNFSNSGRNGNYDEPLLSASYRDRQPR